MLQSISWWTKEMRSCVNARIHLSILFSEEQVCSGSNVNGMPCANWIQWGHTFDRNKQPVGGRLVAQRSGRHSATEGRHPWSMPFKLSIIIIIKLPTCTPFRLNNKFSARTAGEVIKNKLSHVIGKHTVLYQTEAHQHHPPSVQGLDRGNFSNVCSFFCHLYQEYDGWRAPCEYYSASTKPLTIKFFHGGWSKRIVEMTSRV